MTLSKIFQRISKEIKKEVEKNDLAKGFLIGGATVLGTEGTVYIGKKVLKKKLAKVEKNKKS
jgi:hypothetical protein